MSRPGSETPLHSTSTCSGPDVLSSNPVSCDTRSAPIVQQMQPLSSAITVASRWTTSRLSTEIEPKSLTNTATFNP